MHLTQSITGEAKVSACDNKPHMFGILHCEVVNVDSQKFKVAPTSIVKVHACVTVTRTTPNYGP